MIQHLKEYVTWQRLLAAWATMTVVATFINVRLPRDAAGNPTRPKSWWQFFWMMFIDLAAIAPQPGKAGLFGMLPINLPGVPSHTPPVDPAVIGGGQ